MRKSGHDPRKYADWGSCDMEVVGIWKECDEIVRHVYDM